ncbi:MAG: DUF3016 domain-containing protein [Gammaproteobacteria bacterium]
MTKLIRKALVGAAIALGSASAFAGADVTFVHPEQMTDVPRWEKDRDSMQMVLTEHFNALASRLPAGQNLKVEVLDIDLAGDVFPRVAAPPDVRIMKGRADWPHITLRYRVEQDGKVVSSGERQLTDPNYLLNINRYYNEMYAPEKQLLDTWFRKDPRITWVRSDDPERVARAVAAVRALTHGRPVSDPVRR